MSVETELLAAAAKVLDRKGWCQGRAYMPDGRVCAMGAVGIAQHEGEFSTRVVWDALDRLAEEIPEGFVVGDPLVEVKHPVAQYNDHPLTSVEDVKLMFKRSIEEAD